MASIDFGGITENVVTRKEYPLSKAQQVLKDETIAIIGYGVHALRLIGNVRRKMVFSRAKSSLTSKRRSRKLPS